MTVRNQVEADGTLRERILHAAFEAFMQHGYAGASTLEIARRARISKRDLYAQFGSKQAMLAACIESRAQRMQAPVPLPAPHDRASLADTLAAFGARLLLEASRPEVLAIWRLAIMEAERAPEVANAMDTLGRFGTRNVLAAHMAQAQAAGLLQSGDAGAMADQFLALLWSGSLQLRLLLRVAAAPEVAEAKARSRVATETCLRLYASEGDTSHTAKVRRPSRDRA